MEVLRAGQSQPFASVLQKCRVPAGEKSERNRNLLNDFFFPLLILEISDLCLLLLPPVPSSPLHAAAFTFIGLCSSPDTADPNASVSLFPRLQDLRFCFS